MRSRSFLCCLLLIIITLLVGCPSVPPQVALVHQKELEIIEALKASHLAMVDSYIDQKILVFEDFFFKEYGPSYLRNWQTSFQKVTGRAYDPAKDFPMLYGDLVAEYRESSQPLEDIRKQLRDAIIREYANAIAAHKAVERWIQSLRRLNTSQKEALNALLGSIKPGLSLDAVDEALKKAKTAVEVRLGLSN